MKNKKSLLGLGLFALILVLGVGYAVVSSVNLTFGGSATAKEADLKVDIARVVDTKTGSATVEHSLTACSTEDTFTITDMALNEEVTMVYTIDMRASFVALPKSICDAATAFSYSAAPCTMVVTSFARSFWSSRRSGASAC